MSSRAVGFRFVPTGLNNRGEVKLSDEGARLDPADWDSFRQQMHELLDSCVDRLAGARHHPWKPVPESLSETLKLDNIEPASGEAAVLESLDVDIMPYATGNTHPSFFGWVHGSGLPVSVAADMVASTMNSNCGGRDHGAIEVERAVLDWLIRVSGLPSTASGILTTGTSQATIVALVCARIREFGVNIRQTGIKNLPLVRVYASEGTHTCVHKALEVLGHGSESVHAVATNTNGQINVAALRSAVADDRKAGLVPLAVVGTAGSVNTGQFDPLDDLADFCETEDLWFHVDAAFGFWVLLADEPWRQLASGMHRAHSVACDFHKWMSIPYDCGACLIYDKDLHISTFTSRPDYLASQEQGLAGGDLWFCDYGVELSRGSRALKIWAAIKALGVTAFGDAITDNCKQAAYMGQLASESELLELAHPVTSNVCCFSLKKGDADVISAELQLEGKVVFSTTYIDGKNCLRAAIVNHRTTHDDVRQAMADVENIVKQQ